MPEAGQAMVAYFDATYVNGHILRQTPTGAVHQPPKFPPAMWNVSDRSQISTVIVDCFFFLTLACLNLVFCLREKILIPVYGTVF